MLREESTGELSAKGIGALVIAVNYSPKLDDQAGMWV